MRSNKLSLISGICLGICLLISSSCNDPSPTPPTPLGPTVSNLFNGNEIVPLSGDNVIPLTVNGSLCSDESYINKPCVSVTICPPNNNSSCQTVTDILLDTGSYGLRIFRSVLNLDLLSTLIPITLNGQTLAECVQYGDGTKDWGTVEIGDVVLGSEPAVQVPIHIIDSTFSNSTTYCNNAETGPSSAGFNGILGVGLFEHDCGTACTTQAKNNLYYTCTGSNCSGTAVSLENQVQNPVPLLAKDNNGIIVELPLVPAEGQRSAQGYLVLGIGTQPNNQPAGVMTFSADPTTGDFNTFFNGSNYPGFLDTGSNGLFFPAKTIHSLADCSAINPSLKGWLCPSSPIDFSALNTGSTGNSSTSVPFQIGNLELLMHGSHRVFLNIGANIKGKIFDWGLPFFIGRNVYIGIQGRTSNLGTGPYFAY